MTKLTLSAAKLTLAEIGWSITKDSYGEYKVQPKGNRNPERAYYTNDLADAIGTAQAEHKRNEARKADQLERIEAMRKAQEEAARPKCGFCSRFPLLIGDETCASCEVISAELAATPNDPEAAMARAARKNAERCVQQNMDAAGDSTTAGQLRAFHSYKARLAPEVVALIETAEAQWIEMQVVAGMAGLDAGADNWLAADRFGRALNHATLLAGMDVEAELLSYILDNGAKHAAGQSYDERDVWTYAADIRAERKAAKDAEAQRVFASIANEDIKAAEQEVERADAEQKALCRMIQRLKGNIAELERIGAEAPTLRAMLDEARESLEVALRRLGVARTELEARWEQIGPFRSV